MKTSVQVDKNYTCESYLFVCIESTTDLEAIKQSYINTIDELNQEILVLKEAYDQLDSEKQALLDELEKQPVKAEFSPVNPSDEVSDIISLSFSIIFIFFRFLYKLVVQMLSQKMKNFNNYEKISLFSILNSPN